MHKRIFIQLILYLLSSVSQGALPFVKRTWQSRQVELLMKVTHGGAQNRDPDESPDNTQKPSRRPDRKKKKKSSLMHLAEKSVQLSTKTAFMTAKQSGKAAYYLIKPKHVDKKELVGLWRIDQQISGEDALPLECSANIEFSPSDVLVTVRDDQEKEVIMRTPWTFQPSRWPRAAKVEFAAKAFVLEGHQELFYYKGQVDRKLAARLVIKIKGDIYRIEKAGWRGKERKYVKIGTFVARRRVKLHDEDQVDDKDDDDESDWDELTEEEELSDREDTDSVYEHELDI
jgi:hypothetical protein